ncbi:MAG: biopolymer transporter ExbD [Planctomycetota bacterium]
MKFHDRDESQEEETFQVTAMVDVVFILLAFFVLTVRFTGGEREMPIGYSDLNPPAGASIQDLPSEVLVRARPAESGAVWLAVGETVLEEDGFAELTATLTHLNLPELPVVIAADGELSVQDVASVMDAVLASPMSRMSLARLDLAEAEAAARTRGGGDG